MTLSCGLLTWNIKNAGKLERQGMLPEFLNLQLHLLRLFPQDLPRWSSTYPLSLPAAAAVFLGGMIHLQGSNPA
jgi:hypothetical protein